MRTWLEQLERQSEGLHKCMEAGAYLQCEECRLWSNEKGCEAYGLDYTEMNNLRDMLTLADIPYEVIVHMGGYCLRYPSTAECVCSAILHAHSYGAFVGQIEINGLLTPEEAEESPVLGYLTGADVFGRIARHWKEQNK